MGIISTFEASVPIVTFFFLCALLCESRFSFKATTAAGLAILVLALAAQPVLLAQKVETTMLFRLLPITAFLPMMLYLHFISADRFLSTCAIWSLATIAVILLELCHKCFLLFFSWAGLPEFQGRTIGISALVLTAASILAAVFFFLKPLLHRRERSVEPGGLTFLFPTLLVYLLLSYIANRVATPSATVFGLLIALAMFAALIRTLLLSVSLHTTGEQQREMQQLLEFQRRDYQTIRQKMELGRTYRHDMRHHFSILDGMLRRGDSEAARLYIQKLCGTLSALSSESWCANAAINAVLSFYIASARDIGCPIDTDIRLPAELPFDELSLCVILANSLENAIHACRELPDGERWIRLAATLTDNDRLTISVDNPCAHPVHFNAEGFPVSTRKDTQGTGLRSIETAVKKYNGLFRCRCRDGQFHLRVALFPSTTSPPARGEACGENLT